jgi:hypothetical protein
VAAVATVAFLAAASGCVTPSSSQQAPTPEVPAWMVGDSNAGAASNVLSPRPYNGAVGASGYTTRSKSTILDNTLVLFDRYGVPETLLVMGGVVDSVQAPSAEIIAGMEELKAVMLALGLRLIWVLEPEYTYAANMAPLVAWQLGQPESVDCRAYQGPSLDGVHPSDYRAFGQCIDRALADLGVDFTPPPSG